MCFVIRLAVLGVHRATLAEPYIIAQAMHVVWTSLTRPRSTLYSVDYCDAGGRIHKTLNCDISIQFISLLIHGKRTVSQNFRSGQHTRSYPALPLPGSS